MKANKSVQVFFDKEEFDLGREYEPCPSIFEPRRDGVYLVTSTVGFTPDSFRENYRTRLEFRINNEPFESADNDFWGKGVRFANAVQVTAILNLKAGDEVSVFVQSTIPGTILASVPGEGVNTFSAARLVDLG
ncbi:ABC transporter permease [Neobacillus drentensis]|uniref:ABC transporter permease n=1 Tax=Neobacillus drentensis TaxID=220684 RepID=UPI002FFE2AB0